MFSKEFRLQAISGADDQTSIMGPDAGKKSTVVFDRSVSAMNNHEINRRFQTTANLVQSGQRNNNSLLPSRQGYASMLNLRNILQNKIVNFD